MTRKTMIAGNWKMNGLSSNLDWLNQLFQSLTEPPACDVVLCPPATLLAEASRQCQGGYVQTGGQDCSEAESGAHTGDISAAMLKDAGAEYVILGHSERRVDHAETSVLIKAKVSAALKTGLTVILCVGETLNEREAGMEHDVVRAQLLGSLVPEANANNIVIAYEPVWAIGTGKTASSDDANAMHETIRSLWPGDDAEALRILYGGSVKPENASELLACDHIDGALVGGASLDAESFAAIIGSVQ